MSMRVVGCVPLYVLACMTVLCSSLEYPFGLYHFLSDGHLYALFLTKEDVTIDELVYFSENFSTNGTETSNHNFSSLSHSKRTFHEVYNHDVYVAIGHDVIILRLNAEPPQYTRIRIGQAITITQLHILKTAGFRVTYESKHSVYEAVYYKGIWSLRTKQNVSLPITQRDHEVASRSGIISAVFVTVSHTLHYFCYIEALQSGIYCKIMEASNSICDMSEVGNAEDIILPNTESNVMCSSSVDCLMCSRGELLVVKTRVCGPDSENATTHNIMLFNMTTVESITNVTTGSLN